MSPKTDEIMGNSGTGTAVPAVLGAAPMIHDEKQYVSEDMKTGYNLKLPKNLTKAK